MGTHPHSEMASGDSGLHCPEITIYYWGCLQLESWNYCDNVLPFWCCYHNSTPGAEILSNGRRIKLDRNKIVLLAPGTMFSTQSEGVFQHLFIHFQVDFTHMPPGDAVFELSEIQMGHAALSGLIKTVNTCSRDLCTLFRLQSFLAGVLAELPADFLTHCRPMQSRDPRVEKILSVLRKRHHEKLTNAQLAALAGMSENNFLRLFRQVTGTSPQFYLRRERIRRASVLLHCTRKSLDDIAEETGFVDRFHLSRVFRQMTGEPPAAFRKRGYAGTSKIS